MEVLPNIRYAEEIMYAANIMEKENPMKLPKGYIKEMRTIAKQLVQGELKVTEIDLLDTRLPLALAKLLIIPYLQPDLYKEVLNFPSPPDYFNHYFILGNELLIVTCQEPQENHYAEYLFNTVLEIELYLMDFKGEEPLEKGVERITTVLHHELLELMQFDENELDN